MKTINTTISFETDEIVKFKIPNEVPSVARQLGWQAGEPVYHDGTDVVPFGSGAPGGPFLPLDGTSPMAGDLQMNGNNIVGVNGAEIDPNNELLIDRLGATSIDFYNRTLEASGSIVASWVDGKLKLNYTPTDATDAVTKIFIDSYVQGLKPKPTGRVRTTAALPALTYNNGASGVGATITASVNGALPAQDGVTLIVGDVLAVMNQVATLQNGLYTVTQVGDAGTPFILTRSTSMDASSEFNGSFFVIGSEGTLGNANSMWLVNYVASFATGTSPVTFTNLNPATAYVAGSGLNLSGNTFNIPAGGVVASMLANTAITPGNYNGITYDAQGRATSAVAASGEATISSGGVVTLLNSAVIGKVLTGLSTTPGSVTSADSLLSGIGKMYGNLILGTHLVMSNATQVTNVTAAPGDAIAGLSFSALANTIYDIDGMVHVSTTAGSTGFKLGITCPADATPFTTLYGFTSSGATIVFGLIAAPNALTTTAYATAGASSGYLTIKGSISVVTAGTISISFASNNAAGNVTALTAGTFISLRKRA